MRLEHDPTQFIKTIAYKLAEYGFNHLADELLDIKHLHQLSAAVELVADAGFNPEAEELKGLYAELQSQQEK